jgi:hypothetical protein
LLVNFQILNRIQRGAIDHDVLAPEILIFILKVNLNTPEYFPFTEIECFLVALWHYCMTN